MENVSSGIKHCLVTRLGFPFATMSSPLYLSTTHSLVIRPMCKQLLSVPCSKHRAEMLWRHKWYV